jgi:hypothetical protein
VSACLLAGSGAWAQSSHDAKTSFDLGVTYSAEKAQLAPGTCGCFWLQGGGVDGSVNFFKGFGLAASFSGGHSGNATPGVDLNKIEFAGGPRYILNAWTGHASATDPRRLQIFGQGLFGGVHGFDGVYPAPGAATSSASSFAIEAGGGLNFLFSRHFGIRLLDAEYVRNELPNNRSNTQNDMRLGFGLAAHFGESVPLPPVTLACSANPASVFPGEPVAVSALAGGLDSKLNAVYSWTGSGVTGNGATASVATASLTPGKYSVNGSVKEGKAGKEGLKPGETATCSASFTVKGYEPPTISCSASPSTINPGDKSTITALGVSPQNRPLTYSFTAASGTINGGGNTATFDSTGAATGSVAIACNVSDDKDHTATASTNVTITAPYVAPAPHTSALCSISFEKDAKRPTRVDNEAKACLDQVALKLGSQADAKVVVVGEATAAEKKPKMGKHARLEDFAAQRAVNAKEYLVTEKGIDAPRIVAVTGSTEGQTVEDYLLPSGATFTSDVQGTTPVDETTVKPEVRKPLGGKPARHEKGSAGKAE